MSFKRSCTLWPEKWKLAKFSQKTRVSILPKGKTPCGGAYKKIRSGTKNTITDNQNVRLLFRLQLFLPAYLQTVSKKYQIWEITPCKRSNETLNGKAKLSSSTSNQIWGEQRPITQRWLPGLKYNHETISEHVEVLQEKTSVGYKMNLTMEYKSGNQIQSKQPGKMKRKRAAKSSSHQAIGASFCIEPFWRGSDF